MDVSLISVEIMSYIFDDMPWSACAALQGFFVAPTSLVREIFKPKIAFI